MISTHLIGGVEIRFRIPPTTADVLDWKVQIQCMGSTRTLHEGELVELAPGHAQIVAAFRWASQFVELPKALENQEPEQALSLLVSFACQGSPELMPWLEVINLCEAMCAAAALDHDVIRGILHMYDDRNGIPKDWKPKPICKCFKCRSAAKGTPRENPKGETCLFDEVDPRSTLAMTEIAKVEDTSERYYISQIRAALARASDRKVAYEEQQREEKAQSKELLQAKFGG